jgi:transposase
MSDRFDHRFKRKLESDADQTGHGVSNVRRIELITGTGRRRQWSSDDKARIVEESLKPGANVCKRFRAAYASGLDVLRKRQGMRSSIRLCG